MMYPIHTYETTIQIMAVVLILLLGVMIHFWQAYRRKCRQLHRMQREVAEAQAEAENERRRYVSARSVINLIHSR